MNEKAERNEELVRAKETETDGERKHEINFEAVGVQPFACRSTIA